MNLKHTVTVFGVDEQSDVELDLQRWIDLAQSVLIAEGVRRESELSLTFVDEATIADLNEQHMGSDGPTDVLAFPIDADPTERGRWPDSSSSGPDRRELTADDLPILLGDVVICPVVAKRQAPDHAGTFDDEIALLVVHGTLHVLGLDHAEPLETEQMQAKEQSLLEQFYRT